MDQTAAIKERQPLWMPASVRRYRRLGEVLARPRDTHMVYIPAVLFTVGLLSQVIPTDTMLIVGALLLSAVSLLLLAELVIKRAPLRLSTVMVMSLGYAYGIGSANSWFSIKRDGIGLAVYLLKDTAVVTRGMGAVLMSLSVVLGVGEMFERPIFGEDFELKFSQQSVTFLVLGTLVMFAGYASGQVGFQGWVDNSSSTVGLLASIALYLQAPVLALSVVGAFNAPGRIERIVLGLCALAMFALSIPLGRRTLIFALLLTAFMFRLGRFRFRMRVRTQVLLVAVLVGVVYCTSMIFFVMRVAGWSSGRQHLSVPERIEVAIQYFEQNNYSDLTEQFSSNVQKRSFVLGFLSELNEYSSRYGYAYGQDLWGQAQLAIPRAIYPAKDLNFNEEGLADKLYGTTYEDEANSVLTAGVIDFGLVGMIAYPLLFAYLLRKYTEWVGQSVPTFVVCIIICAMLTEILQAENYAFGYLLAMRDGLIWGSVVWAVISLPAFRLKKEGM